MEQRIIYNKKIEDLQKKNYQSLYMMRDNYQVQMKSVNRVFEKTVTNANKIREKYEDKLTNQDDELETEMRDC